MCASEAPCAEELQRKGGRIIMQQTSSPRIERVDGDAHEADVKDNVRHERCAFGSLVHDGYAPHHPLGYVELLSEGA